MGFRYQLQFWSFYSARKKGIWRPTWILWVSNLQFEVDLDTNLLSSWVCTLQMDLDTKLELFGFYGSGYQLELVLLCNKGFRIPTWIVEFCGFEYQLQFVSFLYCAIMDLDTNLNSWVSTLWIHGFWYPTLVTKYLRWCLDHPLGSVMSHNLCPISGK
jgi:hypothetical protein